MTKRARFVPPPSRSRGAKDPRRVARIIEILLDEHAEATTALDHESPYELLTATILSAQCTDARVNMVTPALFRKYPTPLSLSRARIEELEEIIRSTGFFHAKAKNLVGMAKAVVERHAGEIPRDVESLTSLPGVGRKTANVVRGTLFEQPAIIVDTHCSRIARRLGWTKQEDPVKIERDLMKILPEEQWTDVSHACVLHGRAICHSRKPKCEICPLGAELCPSYMLER